MLCRKLLSNAKWLGSATKHTFALGHGMTRAEVHLLEQERQGKGRRLRDTATGEWFIPKHILEGQGFAYETELYSFLQRIGSSEAYVPEHRRLNGEESALSSALVVVLAHPSSCSNPDILELKKKMCSLGRSQLSLHIMNYFSRVFPNITSDLLYKLSSPRTVLSSAKCYSLYKHLCLHELIRNTSDTSLSLEEYEDVAGGIFLSLLLFNRDSALTFLQSSILNYYANIDYRNLVDYDNLGTAEEKLKEYLSAKGLADPQVRMISIDGESSSLPLYNLGIFCDEECIATAADHTVEAATLHACNAALTSFVFSDRNFDVTIHSINNYELHADLIAEGEAIALSLKEILNGVDLSKYELENSVDNGDRTVSHLDYHSLLRFRRMHYKTKSDVTE